MEKTTLTPENAEVLKHLGVQTVYLMGGSFILGALFAIFLLVILEMVRRARPPVE